MKPYTSNPVTVTAEQYTGTKTSVDSLKLACGINHDHVTYDDKGAVTRWAMKAANQATQTVAPGSWFIKDQAGNIAVMTDAEFKAAFSPEVSQ